MRLLDVLVNKRWFGIISSQATEALGMSLQKIFLRTEPLNLIVKSKTAFFELKRRHPDKFRASFFKKIILQHIFLRKFFLKFFQRLILKVFIKIFF